MNADEREYNYEVEEVDIVCHYCGDSINSYEWTLAIEDGIEVYCCPDCVD